MVVITLTGLSARDRVKGIADVMVRVNGKFRVKTKVRVRVRVRVRVGSGLGTGWVRVGYWFELMLG